MPAAEFDFIDWIRQRTPSDPRVVIPIGDDLASLKWNPSDGLLLVGIDQVLDGVHFDSSVHSPRQIGRKAMNRNLSDCAAMACLPVAAVVSAALPRGVSMEYAKEIYNGLREAGDAFDCSIVGGDTGSWNGKLALSVAILGQTGNVDAVARSHAKAGDTIYVSGPLGGSMMHSRHMNFTPRVRLGRTLGVTQLASAMIDLSDGLSRDLGHICRASKVGAVVHAASVPIHEDAIEMRRDGHSPLEHALHDGEDYELLFTSAVGGIPETLGDPFVRAIGVITSEPGIWLEQNDTRTPLEPKGWEHTL